MSTTSSRWKCVGVELPEELGRRPAQDGAHPPSVWRFTRQQSQTQPASAAGPLRPRQRQREGGVHPHSGRSGAERWCPVSRGRHPFPGRCEGNLHADVQKGQKIVDLLN